MSIFAALQDAIGDYEPFDPTPFIDADTGDIDPTEEYDDALRDAGGDAMTALARIRALLGEQESLCYAVGQGNELQSDINDRAARRGKAVIDEYRDRWDVGEDDETPLSDLLADLLHLDAAHPDPDFEAALAAAQSRFQQERDHAKYPVGAW